MFENHLKKTRLIGATGIATSAILLLAACGAADAPAPAESASDATAEEIIAAAEEEGSVVVYTAFPDVIQEALSAAFTEKYGIKVQSERLIQSAFTQRVQAEFEAQQHVVDVLIGSDMSAYDVWSKEDRFETLPDQMPSIADWPENFRTDTTAYVQSNRYGILYNSDLLGEAPQTWEDLVESEYEGQILLLDPAAGTASQYQYNALLEEYGEDFLSKLGDQGSFVDSGVPASQSVGAGAAQIYLPVVPPVYSLAADAGLPVDVVYPEPTVAGNTAAAVPVGAPHPNAAKLFFDFLVSADGQQVINAGGFSALSGLDGVEQLPSDVQFADWEQTIANADTIVSLLKD